jgi:23S rRNA (pseudouridine1915-N3)-methyltransferase
VRVRILAVGTRMPAWVTTAYEDYTRRLRSAMRVDLDVIPVGASKVEEESSLQERLRDGEYIIALDERGKAKTTAEVARWLNERVVDGRDLCFVIGGPDGLGDEILKSASWRWSLSPLTFPHALVRVLLAEQLYRAHSVLHNHPYHRE